MIATTLFVHVFFGVVSLLTGLVIIFMKKGMNAHNSFGWIYFVSMTVVFLTSIVVSFSHKNIFPLLIGLFSFYLVHTRVRYRYLSTPNSVRWWDKLTTIIYRVIYFLLVVYAIYAFVKGANDLGIILSSFGLIEILLWKNEFHFILKNRRKRPQIWLNEHIGRMIGSFIAAFTAFAVNNIYIEPSFITWLFHTALGFPLIIYFTKKKYVRA